MGKITLNEALKKASVKNDLQMFLGLDAQSELGGMTPERLAAVAGGKVSYDNTNSSKHTILRICSLKQWDHTLVEIVCSQSSADASVVYCQICNHSERFIKAKIINTMGTTPINLYLKKDDNSFWIKVLPYSTISIRICTGTDLVYDLKTTATDESGLELVRKE